MRTTTEDVQAIISTTVNLLPFLLTASALVDTYLSTAGLSATLLREIERWWTAHLVALQQPQVTQKRLGQTALTYERASLGIGLKSTRYGQVVLALDSTGTLATMTDTKRASFFVD